MSRPNLRAPRPGPASRPLARPSRLLCALALASGLLAAGTAPAAAPATGGADTLFPRPPSVRAQVAFWTDIYAKYSTAQALIHDSEHLDVIYAIVDLPPDSTVAGVRERRERIQAAREAVDAALERLAEEEPAELGPTEQAVMAAWGEREVLGAARDRVRAQVGQADRFRAGIIRSGAYVPRMLAILTELGLPAELVALPHVESSFDPTALSHRGASGIWQWTRPTGMKYMRIDRLLDERRDPLLATRAAGRALRDYYRELGSWPLAITAYNHGIQGMRRAAAAHGTDFEAIVRDYKGPAFRFASRNFYGEFLAALDVWRNHERHFGPLALDPPLAFDTVRLPRALGIQGAARHAGLASGELARLNPALLAPVTSGKQAIPAGYELRLPAGRGLALAAKVEGAKATPAAAAGGEAHAVYRVRSGDTLFHIARRFNTDVDTLLALNNLESDRILSGQRLLVPGPTSMND